MSSSNNNNDEGNKDELVLLKEQEYIYKRKTDHDFSPEKQVGGITSLLFEFAKQLGVGTEVYRISVPAILIRPVSLLENLANASPPNQFILNAPKEETPLKRMLSLTKFLFTTLLVVPQKGFVGIKPFNPILGEQFQCSWKHKDGSESHYISEQVSHHPPVSAFILYNEQNNFAYTAHFDPKTSFYGNYASTSINSGRYCIYLFDHQEEYEITNPPVLVRGFFWGTSCVETVGELKITCKKSGYTAKIDFKSDCKISGTIFGPSSSSNPEARIAGAFDGDIVVAYKNSSEQPFYSIKDVPNMSQEKIVKPVIEQAENESRRVWHKAAYAILYKDFTAANARKHEVEERQRKKAKDMKEKGQSWKTKLFHAKKQQAADNNNNNNSSTSNSNDEEKRYEWSYNRFTPEKYYASPEEDDPKNRLWLRGPATRE